MAQDETQEERKIFRFMGAANDLRSIALSLEGMERERSQLNGIEESELDRLIDEIRNLSDELRTLSGYDV